MGAKHSALKKEVAALQQEARKRSTKHQEELAIAAKEKRQLQLKIDELRALVNQAQEEAEKSKSEAHEREERMKALKWELVRQLRLTGAPTSNSSRASLSPSASTRIALNWRLNEDVSLRQSVVSTKKTPNNTPAVQTTPNNSPSCAVQTTTPSDTPSHVASNTTIDTAVTETRPMLLAPRRSFIKRSEASATPVANRNQTSEEGSNASEKTSTVTPSATPRESKSSTSDFTASDVKDVSEAPREPSESKSDDPPAAKSDSKSEPSPHASQLLDAKSESSDDDSPETIDVHRFSEEDS